MVTALSSWVASRQALAVWVATAMRTPAASRTALAVTASPRSARSRAAVSARSSGVVAASFIVFSLNP